MDMIDMGSITYLIPGEKRFFLMSGLVAVNASVSRPAVVLCRKEAF